VVELGSLPLARTVTDRTIGGKTCRRVIGVGGLLIVSEVARGTIPGRAGVPPIHVALRARNGGVRAGQLELGEGGVVEFCPGPACHRMAQHTILREASTHVVRILRRSEILQMATDTVGAGPLEFSANVTHDAVQLRMHACKRETRESSVIEGRPEPGVHGVALLASSRQSRRAVIQHHCLQEGLSVAGNAFRRESLELAGGHAFVAGITGDRGMRAHQGEAVLMLAHGLQGNSPALHRVALLALCAELAAMNVRMAIRALGSDVGEHEADMALRAGNPPMKSPQRVMRLVMIELDNIAEGFPSRECVAVLAGGRQISVRAARGTALISLLAGHKSSRQQQ